STTLVAVPNPSQFGQAVTLTATVNTTVGGAGTPPGTVTFRDGSATLGTAALSNGTATLTASSLGVGSHALSAVYGGDARFTASTSAPVTQTVNPAAIATTVASL